jgi:hypothetical protein
MARKFLARIEEVTGRRFHDFERAVVLSAALLHDIGHGPFSHVFEKVSEEHHERRTREIVLDSGTEVNRVLAEIDGALPNAVAAFWDKSIEDPSENHADVPSFLTQIVSSQLDADRFDYLIRDSYAAGVEYGTFDFNWLINHLYLDEDRHRFFLSNKALITAEAYVFARYHMYKIVYYHKTTRSAEVMLRLLFRRYKELLRERSSEQQRALVPDAPMIVLRAFTQKASLAEYLLLDDHVISAFLASCCESGDQTLRCLSQGILRRRLYKAIDVTGASPDSIADLKVKAGEICKRNGIDREFSFVADTPGDTPYKYYDPDKEREDSQIYVENWQRKPVEISTLSEPVERLKKGYLFTRYYFPEAIRDDIKAIASETLRG